MILIAYVCKVIFEPFSQFMTIVVSSANNMDPNQTAPYGALSSSLIRIHSICITGLCLSKTHLSLLSTGLTQEDLSQHNLKIVDWDVKNQINQKL